MSLQQQLIEYLESRGWYFDWEHINEVWDENSATSLNKRPDAIRVLHGWTVPQWGEYWSSDHLEPKGVKPKKRRYENLQDAVWSQLLREEEPEKFAVFFEDKVAVSYGEPCQWVDDESREPCAQQAVVGVGHNAIWVCQEHYEAYLQLLAETTRRAVEALRK